MKFEEYKKPVLISGLISAALLSVPLINLLNCICCLWIIVGAVIGVYLASKDTDKNVTYGDGALIGMLSGIVAAIISTVISSVFLFLGINLMRYIPEEIPEFEQFGDLFAATTFSFIVMLIMLISSLVLYAAFGALGGVIGTAMYGKKKETETAA